MSGATKEIRTQIRSIKSTQKITRAMEMVAASKMRKAQDRMALSRPYAHEIRRVISHVANASTEFHHPFLEKRDVERVGIMVVTSDRGLCGGLNTNLLRKTVSTMTEWREQNIAIDLCLIGTKAEAFFRRFGGKVLAQVNHLGDAPSPNDLVGITKVMLKAFESGEIDALYIIYNDFISTMTQKPVLQQLLPIVPAEGEDDKLAHHWDYIYEPEAAPLLELLLTRYIESQVYQAVVENNASEQAARMVAMKSASDNAGNLINELQLVYNKARQAAITQEIAEIVSGAAAV